VKRPVQYWLIVVSGLVAFIAIAVAIGLLMAEINPAYGASRCAPPDPTARPVVRLASGELRSLAALAWGEARGEPDAYCSMQAVAAVVVNRVRTNPQYYGATINQAIHKPYAFSVFGKRDPNRQKVASVNEADSLFVTALLAAIAAASGADPTAGAVHFWSGRAPRWTSGMLVTVRIGAHTFARSR
jgi:spore germination cell wall hydrolase CwlJ-like protein